MGPSVTESLEKDTLGHAGSAEQTVIYSELLEKPARSSRSRNNSRTGRSRVSPRSLFHDRLVLQMDPSPGDAESTTFQWGRCWRAPHSERDESTRLQENIMSNLIPVRQNNQK